MRLAAAREVLLSLGSLVFLGGACGGERNHGFAPDSGELADAFDGLKDSAVLLDAIRWERTSGTGVSRPTIQ